MHKVTALFSNGHEHNYRGNKIVTAAWMVVRKADGQVVVSGHSLNRDLAERAAFRNMQDYADELGVKGALLPMFRSLFPLLRGAGYKRNDNELTDGFASVGYAGEPSYRAYDAWAKAKNDLFRAALLDAAHVEIISL